MDEHYHEAQVLSEKDANLEERLHFFRKINQDYLQEGRIDNLYDVWNRLFKDTHPVAWIPGSESKSSNLGRYMADKGFSEYRELREWAARERAGFWKEATDILGIGFKKPYDTVLELSPSVEDPSWFRNSELNIAESCFQADPSRTAIIQKDEMGITRKITYGDLRALAEKIASGLKKRGYVKGDRIILYLPMTIEAVASYLALVLGGMSVVSVADSFSPAELRKRGEMTGAKGIFCCNSYLYGGKELAIFDKVKEANVQNAFVIQTGKGEAKLREGDIFFDELLSEDSFHPVPCKPQDVTNILFSSGTTKEPKAIPWTHLTPIKCAADGYFHQDIRPEDTVTWTTGMGWMMAPWLIYATLINKATMALYTGAATGESFAGFVSEAGISILGTIPSVVKAWIRQDFIRKFRWKIKVFSSTGEPSSKEDYFYLMGLAGFSAPVIEYCGGTEIGGGYITGTVVEPASPACFTTPALGLDFVLLKEDGKVAAENEPGEVYIIPPSVGLTQQLLNKDHHEEYYSGVPAGPNGETLRKHGDAFEKVTGFGQIFYKSTGRTDDAMNLGGIKVSSVEIEEVLNTHPEILETAAISVPGKESGPERLVICFVPRQKDTDTERLKKELQDKISSELNPLFRISEIVPLEVLPRTASNKIMRRELRKNQKSGK